jgi:hypothetical protein
VFVRLRLQEFVHLRAHVAHEFAERSVVFLVEHKFSIMQIQSFVGPSYTTASPNVSAQRAINLYPQANEAAAKNGEQYHYRSTPGLRLLATLDGQGGNRGCHSASNGRAYSVRGRNVYDITVPTAPNLVGTMDESPAGPVSMTDDGINLVIANGRQLYRVEFASGKLLTIEQDGLLGVGTVCYIDGYIVGTQPGSQKFGIAGPFDVTSWDPADVDAKSTQPDVLLAAVESFERVCLIGAKSSEAWRNTGGLDFPFQREQEIEIGAAAKDTVALLNGYPIFLAQEPSGNITVTHFYGFVPKRVSTHAVERAITQSTDLTKATAWTYQQEGHSFYVLNLPGLPSSWVYDAATGLWHERTYTDPQRGQMRHRAEHHCFAAGMHIVGDYANGNLYELTDAALDDDGAVITRKRIFPHLSQQGVRLFMSRLQIDMETGVGLDGDGQGTDPQAVLSWSDDGGRSFKGGIAVSIGKIGERMTRAEWRRLGSSRDRVFDLTITDPVRVTLISAWLDAAAGNN